VPVGTEPILPVPQLGTLGRQYGFSAGMSTKPTGMAPSPSRNQIFAPATAQGKPLSSSMSQSSIFMNRHYVAASSSGRNSRIQTQLHASSYDANIGKPLSSSMIQLSIFTNHYYVAASSSGHNSRIKTQLRASSNNTNIDPTLLHTVRAPVKALQHPVAITPAIDREEIGEDGDDSNSSVANMDNSKLALLRV
jgi:hypothetical protein